MPQALEIGGEVFDLPALFAADFLSLFAAAGAASLFCRQLIVVRTDRKIVEFRKGPRSFAPLYASHFRLGFSLRNALGR